MMSRPIGIDLFAGAGGLSLGFEQAGFDVKAAVEIDPVHCAIHEYNFPECATICASVVDLNGEDIRRLAGIGSGEIDVVFGGPPCQGVSLIGHRALDDPRNELMLHFVRLVLDLKPKYFVMENVKGLTIGAHKRILAEVMSTFEDNGYLVQRNYQVLNAASFGVPQSRQRVFVLGCRQGFSLPEYPTPTTIQAGSSQKGESEIPISPTVMDAIGDLPEADDYAELIHRDWVLANFGKPSNYACSLRGMGDSTDFSYPRVLTDNLLTSSMRTLHTKESIERFIATPNGENEPISRFPKLIPNGVCNTLRAGTGSDKGAYTSPRPIHPTKPRCITVREAARLHSYPDWFRLHATKWHGFRQIGNSVPPLLGRAVAGKVAEAIGYKPNRPEKLTGHGPNDLLTIKMAEASSLFGVNRHIMGRRLRHMKSNSENLTFDFSKERRARYDSSLPEETSGDGLLAWRK